MVVLKLNKDREVFVNDNPVAPDAVADAIKDHLKGKSKKVVFFQIDNDAIYSEAVHYMDVVKGAGAETLGIVTE